MAKKTTRKSKEPQVKVRDMKPKKEVKGGGNTKWGNIEGGRNTKFGDIELKQ